MIPLIDKRMLRGYDIINRTSMTGYRRRLAEFNSFDLVDTGLDLQAGMNQKSIVQHVGSLPLSRFYSLRNSMQSDSEAAAAPVRSRRQRQTPRTEEETQQPKTPARRRRGISL